MKYSAQILNPNFIVKKNQSINQDIGSDKFNILKAFVYKDLISGFMLEELDKKDAMIGICGVFFVDKDAKSFKIYAAGNEVEIDITRYNKIVSCKYGDFKMINTFLPFPFKEIEMDDIVKLAKIFAYENNPFAVAVITENAIECQNNITGKSIEFPEVVRQYIEYCDGTFHCFFYNRISKSEMKSIDYVKKATQFKYLRNIDSDTSKKMSELINGSSSNKERYLPMPTGTYYAVKGYIDDNKENAPLIDNLDNQFPPIHGSDEPIENVIKSCEKNAEKLFDNQDDNNEKGFYLFEMFDKKIEALISVNIDDKISNFLNNL